MNGGWGRSEEIASADQRGGGCSDGGQGKIRGGVMAIGGKKVHDYGSLQTSLQGGGGKEPLVLSWGVEGLPFGTVNRRAPLGVTRRTDCTDPFIAGGR
eukprot:753278-Hanusia_phi.AAC.4